MSRLSRRGRNRRLRTEASSGNIIPFPCPHTHAHYLGVSSSDYKSPSYVCDVCKMVFIVPNGCIHLHRTVVSRTVETNLQGEQIYLYNERCLDCGKDVVIPQRDQSLQDECSSCHNRSLIPHEFPDGRRATMCGTCGKFTMQNADRLTASNVREATAVQQRVMQGVINATLDNISVGISPINGSPRGPFWEARTFYRRGNEVYTFDDQLWSTIHSGVSGPQEPQWSGRTVRDGTVIWETASMATNTQPIKTIYTQTETVTKQTTLTVSINPRPRKFNWDA